MSDNSDEFESHFDTAQFTDEEAVASVYASGAGIVASAAFRRIGPPNAFALALATKGGVRQGPFVLTSRVAAELRKALVDSGF